MYTFACGSTEHPNQQFVESLFYTYNLHISQASEFRETKNSEFLSKSTHFLAPKKLMTPLPNLRVTFGLSPDGNI